MAAEFDTSEFVDTEFEAARRGPFRSGAAAASMSANPPPDDPRAPTREELDTRSTEMQSRLAALRQQQNELERERTALEDLRRRQNEFSLGRQEMQEQLTRGIGLLAEAEFAARRDAEQMARALEGMRDALGKVQAINDQAWTKDEFQNELTRALTVIENARLEYHGARLKFPVLDQNRAPGAPETKPTPTLVTLKELDFLALARLGLALTWPLALAALLILVVLWLRR